MSDGTFQQGGNEWFEPGSEHYAPLESGDVSPERTTAGRNKLDLHGLAEWLPLLGPVLWLHRPARDRTFPRARLTPRGVLLLEHPLLAVLADCTAIRVNSAVTPHGPREWLDFDIGGVAAARLYLLPDTDYMAWDAMVDGIVERLLPSRDARRWSAHRVFSRCAFARARHAWQARVVRLPVLHLPCLQVLGLRDVESISVLGRHLAAAIVHDEHARFIDASQRDTEE
jgi:hypothetical protein